MKEFNLQILVFALLMFLFLPLLTAADPIVYESGGRRDPFIPLIGPGVVKAQKGAGDLVIEGIIFDPPAGSLVLINGEFYKQGQHVAEATVISIFQDRIILMQDDEEKTFWLREEILKKGDPKDEQNKSAA